ncbi:MAG: ATP-dependent DNA ligase [Polaromonas sp.]|nr:ATP-dependent DNA ligase [Polaromonas sp.]
MSAFKPTLAVAADFAKLVYPVYASPKLDGIRCSVVDGKALTRSLKAIPNLHISSILSDPLFNGFDGELIIGSATDKAVYTNTVSSVMRVSGQPAFTYYVFDLHDMADTTFEFRFEQLKGLDFPSNFVLLRQTAIENEAELLAYEKQCVELGYEGVILRSPDAPYKYGRSTVNEGYLLKVKRFEDSEARVLGFEEEQFNGNEAQTNELGRTKRSSAKAGKVGKGTMGALIVRDIHSKVEFNIGTGFTAEQRSEWWDFFQSRDAGTVVDMPIVKYKFFPVGVKDAPRHPVYLGARSALDI